MTFILKMEIVRAEQRINRAYNYMTRKKSHIWLS
jgi:hypothetical protein